MLVDFDGMDRRKRLAQPPTLTLILFFRPSILEHRLRCRHAVLYGLNGIVAHNRAPRTDPVCFQDDVRVNKYGPRGCIPFSWVDPVLRFRASSGFCVGGLQSGPAGFVNPHASVPDRFSKTRARRAPRLGARAEEGIMTVETRDSEFRHPEAAAFLRSLTDEEAAKPLLWSASMTALRRIVGARAAGFAVTRWRSTLLRRDFRTCGMDDESAAGN